MQKLIVIVPLTLLFGCLELPGPEVPDGFPALEFGDGAHATWRHGELERDIIAEIGIIDVDGPSVLIRERSEDDPSVILRFPELKEGEYTTAQDGDASTPLIIETDEDGELWGDNFPESEGVTLTIDHFDGRVAAGTFAGSVCSLLDDELVCEAIVAGKFSAIDDRDLQD